MYELRVNVDGIADLAADGVLAKHGIHKLAPSRRQWPRTQPIGEAYFAAGRRGLLVPSAAHVDGTVLVIFRGKDGDAPAGITVRGEGRFYSALPALPTGLRT